MNEDIETLLRELKQDFPALDYPEILKLALSDYHRRHMERRRQEWAESLPTLELSEEERKSLTQAIDEVERGEGRVMTVTELMLEAEQD